MGVIDRVRDAAGMIPEKYDLRVREIKEIKDLTDNQIEAIAVAFRYGFLQGKRMHEDNLKKGEILPDPKYMNEYRQNIRRMAQRIKNPVTLQHLHAITDIFKRRVDTKEYKTLTDLEWEKCCLLSDTVLCDDVELLSRVRTFMNATEVARREKKGRKANA